MKYDPATATFEDDGGPSFDPKPSGKGDPHPHEVDRFVGEGGSVTLELHDRFEQVMGD